MRRLWAVPASVGLAVPLLLGPASPAYPAGHHPGSHPNLVAAPHVTRHSVSSWDGRDECGGYSYDHRCRRRPPEDESRRRDDNRRAGISPGPFDRSPVDIHDNRLVVCFPFSRCDGNEPTTTTTTRR